MHTNMSLVTLCLYKILSLKSIVACHFSFRIRSAPPPQTKWIGMIWYLGNTPLSVSRDPLRTVGKNNEEAFFVQFSSRSLLCWYFWFPYAIPLIFRNSLTVTPSFDPGHCSGLQMLHPVLSPQLTDGSIRLLTVKN